MIPLLDRLHDPDRTVLHRALRVAVVMPLLFAFGLVVLKDGQFALFAAFGSFCAMAFADFMGPSRPRNYAYLGLGVVGVVLAAIGTALSNTLWPAVIAMLLVGTAVQFVSVLGGPFALANSSAILAFVLGVMVPAGNEAILSRMAGWFIACVCSAIVTSLVWPRHSSHDLYERMAEATRSLATFARDIGAGAPTKQAIADLKAAIDRVHAAQSAIGFRSVGPPGYQQALLGIADELGRGFRFAATVVSRDAFSAIDRQLAAVVATTLDSVADVLKACADDRTNAGPNIEALMAARHAHRQAFAAATQAAIAVDTPAMSVTASIDAAFPIRVLSFAALSMATDAIVLTGRSAHLEADDFGVIEPTAAESFLGHAARTLAPHLSLGSVWMRNSLRAGVALALSALVAKVTDIQHAFWVVLATLTVLRSNVATTGSTIVNALIGTFVGFLLATLLMVTVGTNATVLWATLAIFVFLSAYAPVAISVGAGQAMFLILVVELFNLMAPQGWETGAVRLEAVTVGALVALVASVIMWPKGASAALRAEVALHLRAARYLTEVVFGAMLGKNDGSGIDDARTATLLARRRAEEALAAYAGERGAKTVSLPVWALLVRTPVSIRSCDDALIVMWRAGYACNVSREATPLIEDTVSAVCASLGELADRLDNSARPPDRALAALIADLDVVDGTGKRRAEIDAAIAAWIDRHRGDEAAFVPLIGLSWSTSWLGYLAHVRRLSEPALAEVQGRAATKWWQ